MPRPPKNRGSIAKSKPKQKAQESVRHCRYCDQNKPGQGFTPDAANVGIDIDPPFIVQDEPASCALIRHLDEPSQIDHARIDNLLDAARPFAPWKTLSDFEYAESAVQGGLAPKFVDNQLKGFAGRWARGQETDITMKSYPEFKNILRQARLTGVRFNSSTAQATLWGQDKKYTFYYRDPWEWILSLGVDPGLAKVSTWKSRKFYYSEKGCRERFVHEPYTADAWHMVDDELPESNPYPHCWLPLHLWLDKGLVTKHVKMFPIVLRALWLPSVIRNASGNGGGVIIGFMIIVEDPGHPDDRTEKEKYEFAQFKREIYQQVLDIIFKSLYARSARGEPVRCGDNLKRVVYPGFLIESLDMEEAWNFTCCRAGRAKHPCPRCLVRQDLLQFLRQRFDLRTSTGMREVVRRAKDAPNATQREKILMDHGLHDVTHFMWNFRFSDPYQAVSYDLLHFCESGKWGHHLWQLTLDVLGEHHLHAQATGIMSRFPRWRNLKHINDLSTKDFTDGQTHLDILKCILFVIVQLLPGNSSLIQCIRTLLQFRMMTGLKVMTESRMKFAEVLIENYERWCENVSEDHGKSFYFPKQHFTTHALADISLKGVLRNATTRTGEGAHQEIAQHYARTNMRDAEKQIAYRDEEQEAVARTRLIVDDFNRRLFEREDGQEEDKELDEEEQQFQEDSRRRIPHSKLAPGSPDNQWIFGSALQYGDSRSYEDLYAPNNPVYHFFDDRLRNFLHDTFPDEYLTWEQEILVESFQCVYLVYSSKDDWTECEDILRCNNNWYRKGPRYDSVLYNSDAPGLACARLRSLLRCKLPSGRTVDLAIVQDMQPSTWRPRTVWDGCKVYGESKDFSFLLMDYVIRGALLAPVDPPPKSQPRRPQLRPYFLVDVIDGDMFLRALNATEHVCY
ncbi:hypothetical protein K438DRAFT_1975779 [Mycena galopus ATCC 62051]|nr:hypothetical protein K438DRAFT_1975779 [Mycena galopus ATCC 62051]